MAKHDLEHGEPSSSHTPAAEGSLKVDLFYFAQCPNYQRTHDMLREVLAAEGITARISLIAVETQAEAERQRFTGAPTIRINGDDVAPPAPNSLPALACRIYETPEGRLMPMPPRQAIVNALASHRHPR